MNNKKLIDSLQNAVNSLQGERQSMYKNKIALASSVLHNKN